MLNFRQIHRGGIWSVLGRVLLPLLLTLGAVSCGGGGGGGGGGGADTENFELIVHATGAGTVVSSPAGIECGGGKKACAASFDGATSVRLSASAVEGSTFSAWSGSSEGCAGAASCTVVIDQDHAVAADFVADTVNIEKLQVEVVGQGVVTSAPSGIRCGADCTHRYALAAKVVLTAAPASGYRFSGWSGACSGAGACSVSMLATRSVKATFKALASSSKVALNVAAVGAGTVVSSPEGIACGRSCSAVFDSGQRVTLSATPADGSRFVGWSGGCSGTASCKLKLDDVQTVRARFEAVRVELNISKSGSGIVTSDVGGIDCGSKCSARIDQGTRTTLVASAAAGWLFERWGGACKGVAGSSCVLPMDSAEKASARFTRVGFAVELDVAGSGSVVSTDKRVECVTSCTQTFDSALALTLKAVASAGYRFAGWGGDCSGTGACRVAAAADAPQVSARFVLDRGSDLDIGACEPSGKGHDYQVGPKSGQIASLDKVPWERLEAGDTVRIFHRASPYRGKMLLAARGTAQAPVRVCGVKSASGQRPVVEGEDAVARRGLSYVAPELDNVQETRSIIMVDRMGNQDWTAYPAHIQIDGLELHGARPGNHFTNSFGKRQEYVDFGACIWVERGHGVTIADNVVHDCTNGIFSKSSDNGDFAVTRSLRVAGNYLYGNGVVGDEHQHNSYLQSVGLTVEFNRYGPLRKGALGNAIKDRSVGAVIRYNRIEEGAHAIDLVEAEDFPVTAMADPAYRTTLVYGNQIVKNGDTGSVIHYGGDHYGSKPGNAWGEPIYRKGTLYFFHNTIYVTGSSGKLFQLSTTEERAQIWNNVLAFAPSVTYPSLRQGSETGANWTAGGVLTFGRNWINADWADSDPWHPIGGTIHGTGHFISGTSLPISASALSLKAGTAPVDAAQGELAAVADHPVDFQLDAAFRKVRRLVKGDASDLGAIER